MKFELSTEIVSLPSKGILYPKESILSKGEIEMSYMTARHEDILTNMSYIKNGTVIEKLLKALIVIPINFDELLVGDKNAIIIAARVLGYGKDYELNYYDKVTKELKKGVVDLQNLKDKELDISFLKQSGLNEFDFLFPLCKLPITYKILTHGDEKSIDADIKGMSMLQPDGNFEISTRLKYLITSIQGKTDKGLISEFVDNYLRSQDIKALKEQYNKVAPDVDLKYYPENYIGEGIEFQIGLNFFWPDFRV